MPLCTAGLAFMTYVGEYSAIAIHATHRGYPTNVFLFHPPGTYDSGDGGAIRISGLKKVAGD